MKKILITGAKGFLGQNVSKYFKSFGYQTFGIGHGDLYVDECNAIGLDYWYKSSVSINSLREIEQEFDYIVHCGGSGSVGFSIENPYEDFKKTVDGTLEVLEYIRLYNKSAKLIYPSSPAVQGEHPDKPIKEDFIGSPASPYGYHKRISEHLCQSYSEKFNIKISIVRLYSVYGEGLKKQLLWDACNKINNSKKEVVFWGSGQETRDFIHIKDVMKLFKLLFQQNDKFMIVNGGTGIKHTIKEIIEMIKVHFNKDININFNGKINVGNPQYYCSDMTKLNNLEYKADISFYEGLNKYISWFQKEMI